MKRLLLLCSFACLANVSAQTDGNALLTQVISHPGSYSQVCDVMSMPSDIPYRAYQVTDFYGASLSKANAAKVASNRDSLVKAIRTRLGSIDFTRKPQQPGIDPKPEENNDGDAYGCDPEALNPILLQLILNLKAIETLPELLVVEDKLVKAIAATKDEASTPAPQVDGWGVAEENRESDEKEPEEKRDRRTDLFNARVAQRDLVMVIQSLLREQNYAPAMKTRLEKAYQKGIEKYAKENKCLKFQEDPYGDGKTFIYIQRNEFSGVYHPVTEIINVPYTRESRDEVRAAAAQWIQEHPNP
ncbi:MAG: hypothetical protein QM680_06755 [Luteolibacter sp.]